MTALAVAQPTVTRTTAVDAYGGTLSYCSNTALIKFAGLFWLFMDGSATGFAESSSDQTIWCVTSTDTVTWSTPFRPFRDGGQASNPLTTAVSGSTLEWQPGPVVVGAELWVFWTGGASTYRSRRAATGTWTNERLLWNTGTGAASWSSSSLEGAAPGGFSLSPTVSSFSDWRGYVACSPLLLTSGTVAVPITLERSGSVAPDAPAGASAFVKEQKANAILRIASDGTSTTSLSAPVTLGEWGGNYGAWEPTLAQGDDGKLRMFSRNLSMTRGDGEFLLACSSADEGTTWTAIRNAYMQVPSSRPFTRQVGPGRWALVHCDNPAGSTLLPGQTISGARLHGTVFTSGQGVDNFVPGVAFSAGESSVNYPQILADGNDLLVNYTVGTGGSTLSRRHAVVVRLAGINDPATAYIGVRERRPTGVYPPQNVGGAYRFDGSSRAQGSTALTAPAGLTLWTWATKRQDNDVLIDTRGTFIGEVLTTAQLSINGLNFALPTTPQVSTPTFIGAVFSNTAPTLTLYVGTGGTLSTSTSYYQSIVVSTIPADGDTLTVNGATYTWRTSATLGTDVQIGASAAASATNLQTRLAGVSGLNAVVNFTRVLVALTSRATFAASSSTAAVTVETTMPLDTAAPLFGYRISGSTLSPFAGTIHRAAIHAAPLTAGQIAAAYNTLGTALGQGTATGATSLPTPAIDLDPASPNLTEFPALNATQPGSTYSAGVLRLTGGVSAGVELPFRRQTLTLNWRLGQTTAATKYPIVTVGDLSNLVRVEVDTRDATFLRVNGVRTGSSIDPTTWQTLTVVVEGRRVTVAGVTVACGGLARLYLGPADPPAAIPAADWVEYDVGNSTIASNG